MTTRYGLAGLISLLLHGVLVFWGLWRFDLGFEFDPNIEIEFENIELLDPDALQAELPPDPPEPPPIPVGPPAPEPTTEVEGEKAEKDEKAEEEAEKPKPKEFGEKKSRIEKLSPISATFTMLLANRRIRRLPFAQAAADIMAPLPDFEFIIDGGSFDVWRDFDYIVMASADIRSITQTFLAVQYKLSREEIKAGLERSAKAHSLVLDWERREGLEMANPRPSDPDQIDHDPRWFVFLEDDNVAVYIREEYLPHIIGGPNPSKGKTAGNFVANIARMRRFTWQEPKAGLQLVFKELRSALKSVKGLPFEFPDDIEVMVESSKDPQTVIKLNFLEEAHAEGFVEFWKGPLAKLMGRIEVRLYVGSDYEDTEIDREGKQVVLRNRFNSARAEAILEILAKQSRKMMRKSKEEMQARREARDALAKLRKGKKLSPSEALALQNAQLEERENQGGEESSSDGASGDGDRDGEAAPSEPAPGEALKAPPSDDALPDVEAP